MLLLLRSLLLQLLLQLTLRLVLLDLPVEVTSNIFDRYSLLRSLACNLNHQRPST
jgi:hypothetical protein